MTDFYITAGDEKYPIRFTSLALYQLEESLDCSVSELSLRMTAGNVGVKDTLQMLCAGLEGSRKRRKSGRDPYSLAEASEIMDEAGGYVAIIDELLTAFAAAFPDIEEAKREGDDENPTKANAGTGNNS